MNTTTRTTFRKTKSGEWVAFGPASIVRPRTSVRVTKRSGQVQTVIIETVGRPFKVDGVDMVYGYIERPSRAPRAAAPVARQRDNRREGKGGICDECDQPRRNLQECRDSSGILGLCCPRCAAGPAYERSFA
ncbi:hypothetical protein [Phytoactinopolyspora limicola]|uniref:hypothetical protein n=1 Tax=Phytoactinopolyspora limicola TaxID=2715536 RepID=UPI0014096623|nr:hypothetical protein [Phytoactinopolyspora limicola]